MEELKQIEKNAKNYLEMNKNRDAMYLKEEHGTFEHECDMREEASALSHCVLNLVSSLKNQKHIFLYADEFKNDIWNRN